MAVRVYFDVSCLNRPFDDQRQLRIRLEAEAVLLALEKVDGGTWTHVSSEIAVVEIEAIPDEIRRGRILAMLPASAAIIAVTEPILMRASALRDSAWQPLMQYMLQQQMRLGRTFC